MVDVTEPAEMEIDAVYMSQLSFNVDSAKRWHDGLLDAFDPLTTLPHRFAIAPDSEALGGNVRVMLYGKGSNSHRILYRIIEPEGEETGVVHILRVRHSSQRRIGELED